MALRDNLHNLPEVDDEDEDVDSVKEPIPLSSLKQEPEEEVQEVEIDIKKKQNDNKATLNIKNPSFIKDFVNEPTRNADDYGRSSSSSSSSESSPEKPAESVEEIRRRLEQEEQQEANKLSPEDFEDAADFIIDLIDMALLFGIRWYSMDTTDAEYKVPEEKLKKLKKHLARVLMRMGKKFPMGILLVLGIIAAYATPMRKAHEHRKKVQAEKVRKKIAPSSSKSGDDNDEEDEPKYVPIKKRKRGGQSK